MRLGSPCLELAAIAATRKTIEIFVAIFQHIFPHSLLDFKRDKFGISRLDQRQDLRVHSDERPLDEALVGNHGLAAIIAGRRLAKIRFRPGLACHDTADLDIRNSAVVIVRTTATDFLHRINGRVKEKLALQIVLFRGSCLGGRRREEKLRVNRKGVVGEVLDIGLQLFNSRLVVAGSHEQLGVRKASAGQNALVFRIRKQAIHSLTGQFVFLGRGKRLDGAKDIAVAILGSTGAREHLAITGDRLFAHSQLHEIVGNHRQSAARLLRIRVILAQTGESGFGVLDILERRVNGADLNQSGRSRLGLREILD